jgi:predicted nucleotidyltransferase
VAEQEHHRDVLERFAAASRADARVVAAFVSGSYARDAADVYSDLDLGLVTTDDAYEEFITGREAFVRLLGKPLFVEDFDLPNIVFAVLADGTELEVAFGSVSRVGDLHAGPYLVVVDKEGILPGAVRPWSGPPVAEQTETLRRLVYWFWHDVSHFVAAVGRGQLWWAQGQLEELRRLCVNLARLRHSFATPADGYEKLDKVLPDDQLAPLRATYGPVERDAMLRAMALIVAYYRKLATRLAEEHGIAYPVELDRIMSDRLAKVTETSR